MLVRCLYASRPAESVDGHAHAAIFEQSRRNNPRLGVTGLLCSSGDAFVQVIEGGRDPVCELYNAIVRDDRHRDVRLLAFEEISERRFGNWTMGDVNLATVNPALLLKYAERPVLDPFAGSGRATMALLEELNAIGAIANRTA